MVSRKSGWTAAGGGLVALVLVLVAVAAVVRPWGGDADPAATMQPPLPPPPVPVLAAPTGAAPAPTAGGVSDAIDELVHGTELGGQVSAAVVDVATGQQLYGRDPDTPAIPASTIKLVTAATVLATRGPAHQLSTVALAGEEPGEVVLVGGGDPTLTAADPGFYPVGARLDDLAEQVRESLGDTPPRTVTVDSSLFSGPVHGPWDDDIPGSGYVGPITALMTDGGRIDPDPEQGQQPSQRWEAPDLAAGEAFAELLEVDPDEVTPGAAPAAVTAPETATAPPGQSPSVGPGDESAPGDGAPEPTQPGAELGRVESPPVLRLVEIMLGSSDNVMAEALARQVALARGEPATFEGAAAAMAAVLADLGVAADDSVIADGSGLSRDNELTATLLTELLAVSATSSTGEPAAPLAGMFAGLPVAGWSGTLADRYRAEDEDGQEAAEAGPGAGSVRAKTGSLNGVNALAGLVVTVDGRLLAFALLTNEVSVDVLEARAALDEIATELASCGCR